MNFRRTGIELWQREYIRCAGRGGKVFILLSCNVGIHVDTISWLFISVCVRSKYKKEAAATRRYTRYGKLLFSRT